MAAEEFGLIPKHMYISDQPHAAQILLDNSIKHKKPQLSYLNRLRPLNESARTTTSAIDTPAVIPPTPEPPIVAKAENNPQKQALLLTSVDDDDDDDGDDDDDDEGNEMEKSVELSEALSTERILLQLQLMDEH
ncbi:DNA mismatch repair protein Msh6-like [Symsagittifera roscoffensis]|uniref:DNA mismatch repair protein Msh6-like n=1 Tax=Symsagittifera roscoffensis TaxID=84072 RepID=UPI00307C9778